MTQLLLALLTLCTTLVQNPYVGTWECYDIKSREKKTPSIKDDFPEFTSTFMFNSDLTYTKTTNGKLTNGVYEFTDNRLYFFEENMNGEKEQAWMIRWPKKTNDPSPLTPEIDFCYPELFTVQGEYAEVDVYYKKTK